MPLQQQDWQHLMNQCRVNLPGASEAGIKSQLFDTLTDFFRDSMSWTEDLSVALVADITDYTLTPADDGLIIELAGVTDSNGMTVPAILITPNTLRLANKPNAAATVTVTVIKNVSFPTTRDMVPLAPSWVLQLYHNVIQHGVVGQMMLQPDKPYTDAKSAAYYMKKFLDGVAVARSDAFRRRTIGTQAWVFPQTFRTSTQRGAVYVGNPNSFGLTTNG